MKKLLIVIALVLCAPVVSAQQWVWVANESDVVTTTAPVTYRYGTSTGITYAGVDCSIAPGCYTAAHTGQLSAVVVTYTLLGDPAPGVSKGFWVQQTTAVQVLTVNGNPVTVTAFVPPAAPAITFTPNVLTTFSVTNVPPATPNGPLQGLLQIQAGNTTVTLKCTYATTLVDGATPPSYSAVFTCLPVVVTQ
jgi:hypothetical protein